MAVRSISSNHDFLQNNKWTITTYTKEGKYAGSHKPILPKVVKFIRELYNEKVKYAFVYFNNTDSLAANGLPDAVNDGKYLQKIVGL